MKHLLVFHLLSGVKARCNGHRRRKLSIVIEYEGSRRHRRHWLESEWEWSYILNPQRFFKVTNQAHRRVGHSVCLICRTRVKHSGVIFFHFMLKRTMIFATSCRLSFPVARNCFTILFDIHMSQTATLILTFAQLPKLTLLFTSQSPRLVSKLAIVSLVARRVVEKVAVSIFLVGIHAASTSECW